MEHTYSAEAVRSRLSSEAGRFHPVLLETVDSTNNYLKREAEKGAPEGTAALAVAQTGGKGRLGRSFASPPGGVYLSVLLRPALSARKTVWLTALAAVAAAEAIAPFTTGIVGVKWVNDVYIGTKKAVGILAEGAVLPDGGLSYVVVGMGVNLAGGTLPPALAARACALDTDDRAAVAASLLNRLAYWLPALENGAFLPRYRALSIVLGKRVDVCRGTTRRGAVACAIDDAAGLIVRYDDGTEETLSSGEVDLKVRPTGAAL